MKAPVIAFLALVVCSTSCNRDNTPNAAPITQHYTTTYNVTTGLSEMRASFFYNPNNSVLPPDYTITCNGITLDLVQNYYTDTAAGNPDAHFVLRTSNGTLLENTMLSSVIPLINFDSSFTATLISRSDTLVVPFSGGPLTNGASVSISISQDAVHTTYHHNLIAAGDSVITFLPADLSVLQNGPATITISRIGPAWSLLQVDPGGGGDMRYINKAVRTVTIVN